MENLKKYVERLNMFRSYSDNYMYDVQNLTQEDINSITGNLDSDMSPESLHCDGEISLSEARRKAQFYSNVMNELQEIAVKNNFNIPITYSF